MNPASVLVVEDEAIVQKDIIRTLESMHYESLCTAGTGDEAVRKARVHRPDIVLMDIDIPGSMDGVGAARIIQIELQIPVIFLTGYSDDSTIERAKRVDPYGYVLKPFTGRDLKVAIEIALFRKTAHLQKTAGRKYGAGTIKDGSTDCGELSSLSDIRALLLGDFFHDIVLLLYDSPGVKELVFTSFIERNLKHGGNLLFAYTLSRAHRKFQREIQQGSICICRMKGGDVTPLQQILSEYTGPSKRSGPYPLRFIVDFSEPVNHQEITGAVDQIVALQNAGVPVCGIIALYVGARQEHLAHELAKSVPKVIVTTNRGTVISCADHSFPLDRLSFLPQPVVSGMVKKVLEPVILSFLKKPVTGSDILHGIYERYNVSVPKARIYTRLYELKKMGYLATHDTKKAKLYYPTEAGKVYIRQKLDEFNLVFNHLLVEVIDNEAGISGSESEQ